MEARFPFAVTVAIALLAPMQAPAQQDTFIYATSYIEVAPADTAAASGILVRLAEATREEAGLVNFEIAQRILPTSHFVIFGAWKDRQAYDAHLAAAHTKQATAALAPQLIAPIDTQTDTQIVAQDLRASPAGTVFGITHFAVLPDRIRRFVRRCSNTPR
jgi:quinol monooxygenase YgiN